MEVLQTTILFRKHKGREMMNKDGEVKLYNIIFRIRCRVYQIFARTTLEDNFPIAEADHHPLDYLVLQFKLFLKPLS